MRRTFASASFFCTFALGILIFFFHEFFRSVFCAERFFCYICNVIVIHRLICLVRFWI